MTTTRLTIGSPAPDFTLQDAHGQTVALNTVWSQQPLTLLTFLRHFGCLFCRQWLAELEAHKTELHAAGLHIHAVAMGEPKHAARYCGELAPSLSCLVNETSAPYNAYGLQQAGLGEFFNANVAKNGQKALQNGATVGQIIGDPRMMPGNFLIDQRGVVQWAHYSKDVSDHPTISEIIAAASTIAKS
jgi:peroxiredoxin